MCSRPTRSPESPQRAPPRPCHAQWSMQPPGEASWSQHGVEAPAFSCFDPSSFSLFLLKSWGTLSDPLPHMFWKGVCVCACVRTCFPPLTEPRLPTLLPLSVTFTGLDRGRGRGELWGLSPHPSSSLLGCIPRAQPPFCHCPSSMRRSLWILILETW